MSANTPLMSDFPLDHKEPVQSELPIYRLNEEAVELTVGGSEAPGKRACFWKRFGHGRCCRGHPSAEGLSERHRKRCLAKRILRGVMIFVFFFSLAAFLVGKMAMHCTAKSHPVTCVPLEEGSDASLTLALASQRTHIGLHHSVTGADFHVTHSDAVEEGNVAFKFDLPKDITFTDDEGVPEYFVCSIAGPKFVGVGIHSKDCHAEKVKPTSTTVTLSSAEAGHSRSMALMSPKPFGHKLLHKLFSRQIRKSIREAVKAAVEQAKIEHSDVE
ncbi:hypothetical protein FRB94_003630 [Tulasnella sp. JGI-2019a]|nr:hypothetical protein FRB94_003630 [Tulasnella sp. JGI-2019a]KAG9008898.1 hypothetical protein FRB93_005948 [Tulasnella sp. JGI-2019a]KAG9038220.1 hypothetical protein FRB95_002181 [Tulasnella sp. JGI-2019a]